jgi:hypothetical protein
MYSTTANEPGNQKTVTQVGYTIFVLKANFTTGLFDFSWIILKLVKDVLILGHGRFCTPLFKGWLVYVDSSVADPVTF